MAAATGTSVHEIDKSPLLKDLLEHLNDGVYFLDKRRRITYWNAAAARQTGYAAEEVLGRCCAQSILIHVNPDGRKICRGACPASRTIFDGKTREVELFLHHKEGHRVPVKARVAPVFDEQGQIIGAVQVFQVHSLVYKDRQELEDLKRRALIDPDLEIANRAFLERSLDARLNELRRLGRQLGAVLFQMDAVDPARLNEETAGRVLKMVAHSLANGVRSFDSMGRWEGDRFLGLIITDNPDDLMVVANKLRKLVEQSSMVVGDAELSVTVTGSCSMADRADDAETLIERLRVALERGRGAGVNHVIAC